MSNDPSDSKLHAHESFWTIAFRVQYLAFCREVDKDNPDIYAETLARLHIVDGKQREPDEGSKLSLLPLAETGKAQGGTLPLPSVGEEQLQTPAPTVSPKKNRPKKEATKGSKLDLKPAAEYYKDGAVDELQVEVRKDQRGVSPHADKKEGSCASQLLPLQVNGGKEPIIKSGKLDLKASAEYYKDLRAEQKPLQDVDDSQQLQSPSKSAEEQWTNYFEGAVSIQQAEIIIRRRNLKGRRKRKAMNRAVYERCGFRFSELQNFFKFESYHHSSMDTYDRDYLDQFYFWKGYDKNRSITLAGPQRINKTYRKPPNRRYKKDYNQYQRDLAAKAKDQCQNKSAKSADTNTKAKDRCQDKSAKSANTTTKPKGRRSLKATKRAAAKLKPKPKPISAIELARAIPETGIHSSALLAIFVGRIGDLPGQTPKRAFFDMVKKNGKYSADKLLRPNEFPNIFRQHTKKETE